MEWVEEEVMRSAAVTSEGVRRVPCLFAVWVGGKGGEGGGSDGLRRVVTGVSWFVLVVVLFLRMVAGWQPFQHCWR